ncbi:MAG: aspartyl-tRNA(Asn)/glutamyl-tRNA (Gln) amidotransferase subunit A [Parcubacteria group bacterium Gr01-1014_29]|nr:MAG: aspartyl-tRNA(Asn)/glutamyl-tRNA (Gln) amidotransferase subunit A [Parcubacteria group bacterium Gr01-1014_29]
MTIRQARDMIARRETTVHDLTDHALKAIRTHDGAIHAFLDVYEEELTRHSVSSQFGIEGALLAGIPIAIKDNILIAGKKATAGSKMLETYEAAYDATVITKLKEAGAVFIGKTNMDEFAMGSSTENSAFGPTKNPHDPARVPGGSSGGSAAAVAAGECIAALGSDTGGSIRQPAAFCGVVGLKPTYGAVSRNGLIAMASSLDVIGPITKTVEDAEIMFNVIKGKDPLDSTTVELHNMEHGAWNKEKKLRIGVPKEYFGEGLHPEVKQAVEAALKMLHDSGFRIHDISLPHSDYALAAYYIIMPAEISANLARLDGIRYGLSKDADDLLGVYMKSRRAGFGAEVRRRIILGTYVLSAGYYDAYYTKAQQVRSLIKRDFEKAFEEVDVIVSPTTPTPAFKFGEKSNDPVEMYLSDIYTVSANLAGIPALSVPCGVSKDGLPIGIQFMGRWFEEEILFEVGKEVEKMI